MKFKKAVVVFRKEINVTVIFPADYTKEQIEEAARIQARDGLDGWYEDEWDALTYGVHELEIPAEECGVEKHPKTKLPVAPPAFGDALVYDPEREEFVNAADADWWIVPPERLMEIQAQERLRQDIFHPDQLPLFGDME
jgi:hypothetical protein